MSAPRLIWIFSAIGILVFAGCLLVLVDTQRQAAAVRAIEGLGGGVGITRHFPRWQRELIGDPKLMIFENVEFVNWAYAPITDAELDLLGEIPGLKRLNLRHTRITDAGLARLKELPRLEVLLLKGTDVTDAGVAELQEARPGLSISQ